MVIRSGSFDWFSLRATQTRKEVESRRRADVDIMNPERYEDYPVPGESMLADFFPNDTIEGTEEGNPRFEDMDGSEPRGRSYEVFWEEELDPNKSFFPENSFDRQTSHGFQEEAEAGSLRELTNPAQDGSELLSLPDPQLFGRAADVRTQIKPSAKFSLDELVNTKRR